MAPVDKEESGPASVLWTEPAPGKLVGPGHAARDFLEAYEWDVIERGDGRLRVGIRLPDHLRNPKG